MWRSALLQLNKFFDRTKIIQYARVSFELQIILTLMLMPFFIWWGLPISIMSWLGNMIFLPFLWMFMLLSCGVLILDFAHLHHTIMHHALAALTDMWLYLLQFGSPLWMIGLNMYLFIPCCIISGLFFYWCTFYKTKSWQRMTITLLSLLFLFGINELLLYFHRSTTISYRKKTAELVLENQNIICIDHGLLDALKYQTDFVEYTLLSTCWRTFGTNKIAAIMSSNTTAAHKLAHDIFYFTGKKPKIINVNLLHQNT